MTELRELLEAYDRKQNPFNQQSTWYDLFLLVESLIEKQKEAAITGYMMGRTTR